MDLGAVRTFVAVADAAQFQAAADSLGVTQQAVSKRIATLERTLGVSLFVRSARGTQLSVDGQAFLPHARELMKVAARATDSVRPGRRALRVDVLNRRTAPATSLRAFHRIHPEVELDIITLPDAHVDSAVAAVLEGCIDATFRSITAPRSQIHPPIRAARVIDDRHQLLVGPRHPLANADSLTLADLCDHRIWMPGMRADTEWGAYYADLGRTFRLQIDTMGPSFGVEALLDELADSAELSTFIGEGSRYLWPEAYDLRRIPIVDPCPVYPHSIIWREDNTHPVLAAFLDHLHSVRQRTPQVQTWAPDWAN
ncbi:DNA-binding transcriptional LysR family regulator [Mycobacterium frederiksbergense]|uniref:DNA-binding transcriptional LysR family regulator n=1 Tax=Mycolicibacterium frederiksbergense TaxID=117567 RepID=A0ABT6L7Z1_9MYCO|nr:LysR family transcriptional regulator [Mycolicibacterium frederiksbergense]MDH6198095.1 DNA-binding transcriptional LysR family regulator [Mycolicibacterium frederiksbergense]